VIAPLKPTPGHVPVYNREIVEWEEDGRLFSPTFPNNAGPICDGMRPYLAGRTGTVLEIGAGTGQHISHFAAEFPGLRWIPSDIHAEHRASVAAWRAHLNLPNLEPPIFLDAAQDWAEEMRGVGPLAAVLCFNVLHIAPWAVAEGVMRGAAATLAPGAALILYGAFKEGGQHTGEGNVAFDTALRTDNPDWGIRDLDELAALAAAEGLGAPQVGRLPSNNLLVGFRQPGAV
jgi:SAM-dependent methyltransferase